MKRYLLSPLAQRDLICLNDYYLANANPSIARQVVADVVGAFRTLARNPGLGHKRQDIAGDRPILFWPVRDYLVVYRAASDPLEIVMIVRGSRDFPTLLTERSS